MKRQMAMIGLLAVGGAWNVEQLTAQPAPPPPVVSGGASYEHSLERSRFDVGAGMRREVDGPYERVVGDKGVFLIDRVTGATLAVPNTPLAVPKGAPISAANPQPLTERPTEHDAMARAYLLAAGVPEAEVSGSHVTTTMAGSGPTRDGVQPSRSTLLWYTTHLERSLGGVPVEGSFAFVALDRSGRVITEGVYWPAIPERIARRALALQQRLASANDHTAFLAIARRLRPDIGDARGTIGIVHTSAGYHGDFQANALYSVMVRNPNGGKAQIIRFDDTGTPVRMVDEVPSGVDSPKRR
jgi:hypothetical protein